MKTAKRILPIIVLSQFCCTSLWFAGNGVMTDLIEVFSLDANALGNLTSCVQFGFIIGTLVFAILTIADRFSPSKVFLFCAILGSIFNVGIIWEGNSYASILTLRFATGFFLAGIYPVGMKIAADYYEKGLGKSLGFLVGALVLGTALPHLLKGIATSFLWKNVILCTSFLAILGGLLMISFVPDGPFRKISQKVNFSAFFKVFSNQKFRSAAFGYFGHMWELYAFWAFVPMILNTYSSLHMQPTFDISFLSFFIIGIGGLSCVLGGYLSQRFGASHIAFLSLLFSCICCLISPYMFTFENAFIFICFLLIWGMTVIADSPLFSTLVAYNAPQELKGTALTIVNCIGFSLTIISIQLLSLMSQIVDSKFIYLILSIGPILGLISVKRGFNILNLKEVDG